MIKELNLCVCARVCPGVCLQLLGVKLVLKMWLKSALSAKYECVLCAADKKLWDEDEAVIMWIECEKKIKISSVWA